MIKKNRIAIYARLSKEDEDDGTRKNSVSINHQITTCKNYLKDNNLVLVNTYFDDGYSGSNFNRPSFKQMILDLENKKFDGIIVKDLSRLGRDFLKTSYYIEDYFPSIGARFISINDRFDSFDTNEADMMVAISNFLNGFYLKECRKKQKQRFDREGVSKALSHVGIYGYKVFGDEYEIDPYSASIVVRIFDEFVNEDKSMSEIANELNNDHVLTPYHYKKNNYEKGSKKQTCTEIWNSHHVRRIIDNRIYTGDQVNFIFTRTHEGPKKVNKTPTILKNHHTAIITKSMFAKAHSKIRTIHKNKTPKIEKLDYLRKFFFDEEDHTYTPHATGMHNNILKYKLRTPSKYETLDGDTVHKIIFKELKQIIRLVKTDENEFYKRFSKMSSINKRLVMERRTLLIEKGTIEAKIQTLFEDYVSNKISDKEYKELTLDLTFRNDELEARIEELNAAIDEDETSKQKLKQFVKEIKEIENFKDKLEIARTLIEKVIVSKVNKDYKFKIIYKFYV